MSTIRVGPGGIPSRDSAAKAIETLIERGYDACEIDFSDGFWMDRDYAQRLGSLAKDAGMALSIHAPLADVVDAGLRGPVPTPRIRLRTREGRVISNTAGWEGGSAWVGYPIRA